VVILSVATPSSAAAIDIPFTPKSTAKRLFILGPYRSPAIDPRSLRSILILLLFMTLSQNLGFFFFLFEGDTINGLRRSTCAEDAIE